MIFYIAKCVFNLTMHWFLFWDAVIIFSWKLKPIKTTNLVINLQCFCFLIAIFDMHDVHCTCMYDSFYYSEKFKWRQMQFIHLFLFQNLCLNVWFWNLCFDFFFLFFSLFQNAKANSFKTRWYHLDYDQCEQRRRKREKNFDLF